MQDVRLRSMALLALAGLLVCWGCQGGEKSGALSLQRAESLTTPQAAARAQPGALITDLGLPAPTTLLSGTGEPRQSAYLPEDLIHEAELIDLTLPNNRVAATAGGATFTPAFTNGSPLSDAAYATYAFDIEGYDKNSEVRTEWIGAVPPAGSLWIALADFEHDSWDWFAAPSGSTSAFPADIANYFNPSGDLLVVVLLIGSTSAELDRVRIGSDSPVAAISVTGPHFDFLQLETSFDASASSDPNGGALTFEWDFEGDGIFETNSGSIADTAHTYNTPGGYNPTVRVTADSLLSSTASARVNVGSTWVHTLGRGTSEIINDVAITADGDLWACGRTSDLGTLRSELLLLKYAGDGTLLLQRSWALSTQPGAEHTGRSIVSAADGGAFLVGLKINWPELATLVQRYDAEGVLLWSTELPYADFGSFHQIMLAGNTLYLCGSVSIVENEFGTFASLNLDGQLFFAARTQQLCSFEDIDFQSGGSIGNLVFCGQTPVGDKTDLLFAIVDPDEFGCIAQTWGTADAAESGKAILRTGTDLFPEWGIAFGLIDQDGPKAGVIKAGRANAISRSSGNTQAVDLVRSDTFGLRLLTEEGGPFASIALLNTDLLVQDDYCFSPSPSTSPRSAATYGDALIVAGGAPSAQGGFDSELFFNVTSEHNNSWNAMTLSVEVMSGSTVDSTSDPNVADQTPMVEDVGGGDADDAWITMHMPPEI